LDVEECKKHNVHSISRHSTASLILTGDQIYADDVSIQLFRAIRKIVDDIFGYDEVLPSLGAGFPVRAADFTAWRNQDGAPYGDWSHRRKLTHRLTSKIGFTTEDGEAHLLSFSEYAAMYLIVWGSEVCKNYLEPGTDKTLENYHEAVKACRRVMANIAVYMMFDDHEITDDWNLSEEWIQKTKSNVMAKRIISNGLAAYWAFQGGGTTLIRSMNISRKTYPYTWNTCYPIAEYLKRLLMLMKIRY
jgi:hypothetical protein